MESTIKLNPLFKILILVPIALKLDGKLDVSWMHIFTPLLIVWAIDVISSIIVIICNIASNIKRNQEINIRYNGQKLYWDATNKRMYGPFETEDEPQHQ